MNAASGNYGGGQGLSNDSFVNTEPPLIYPDPCRRLP